MTTPPVALAVPPTVVLQALGTGRWHLAWSDEVYRQNAAPVRRHRWMLDDPVNDRCLLVEADRHGVLRDHSTLSSADQSWLLHTEDQIRDAIHYPPEGTRA